MSNARIRKVKALQGTAKDMAEKQGWSPDDLVVLSLERVIGDPVSFLLPVDDLNKEIGASYSFFSTNDGEVFSGGGEYDVEELVDDVINALKPALLDLLDENPNRTMTLVIDTDDYDYRSGTKDKNGVKTKEEIEWKLNQLKAKQEMAYTSERFALMVALDWVLREDKDGLRGLEPKVIRNE